MLLFTKKMRRDCSCLQFVCCSTLSPVVGLVVILGEVLYIGGQVFSGQSVCRILRRAQSKQHCIAQPAGHNKNIKYSCDSDWIVINKGPST